MHDGMKGECTYALSGIYQFIQSKQGFSQLQGQENIYTLFENFLLAFINARNRGVKPILSTATLPVHCITLLGFITE